MRPRRACTCHLGIDVGKGQTFLGREPLTARILESVLPQLPRDLERPCVPLCPPASTSCVMPSTDFPSRRGYVLAATRDRAGGCWATLRLLLRVYPWFALTLHCHTPTAPDGLVALPLQNSDLLCYSVRTTFTPPACCRRPDAKPQKPAETGRFSVQAVLRPLRHARCRPWYDRSSPSNRSSPSSSPSK
jgi:hypothetical protein